MTTTFTTITFIEHFGCQMLRCFVEIISGNACSDEELLLPHFGNQEIET
jgi:hypothetical protein